MNGTPWKRQCDFRGSVIKKKHASTLLSLRSLSRGSQLPYQEVLEQPVEVPMWGGTWVPPNSWHWHARHVRSHEAGPPAPVEPSDDHSPGQHLDCSLMSDLESEMFNALSTKFWGNLS